MKSQQLLSEKMKTETFKNKLLMSLSSIFMVIILTGFALLLFGCSSDDSISSTIDDLGDEVEDLVTVNSVVIEDNPTFGNILTDSDGYSLYFFSKDVDGTSECANGCIAAWPIFYDANLTVGEGLDASDFDVITREDGAKQNTYKGWPLYYYASDGAPGDTDGDGAGSNWFVAKPDYSLMYAQADIDDVSTFYMTNATGRTIYLFANDTNGVNNFTNSDFSNNTSWPVISLTIDKIPSILDIDDFGTIDVHGTTQVTYKGWPLYYFGNDTERGDINGVSGTWPIVNVDTEDAPSIIAE